MIKTDKSTSVQTYLAFIHLKINIKTLEFRKYMLILCFKFLINMKKFAFFVAIFYCHLI